MSTIMTLVYNTVQYLCMHFITDMSRPSSLSIVEYFAENEGYKCGYCGKEDTNFSHGMWAHTLATKDYQVNKFIFNTLQCNAFHDN